LVDLLPNDKYHDIVRQAAEVSLTSPGKEGGLANVVSEDIMMEEEDEIKETIVGDFFDEFTTRAATGRLLSTHHTSPTASLPPSSADCTPLAPPLRHPTDLHIHPQCHPKQTIPSAADLEAQERTHLQNMHTFKGSTIGLCKKYRASKSCDNHVIYQFEKLKKYFTSALRALYIHLQSGS